MLTPAVFLAPSWLDKAIRNCAVSTATEWPVLPFSVYPHLKHFAFDADWSTDKQMITFLATAPYCMSNIPGMPM
jgi:hypothetical protein